jgi:hypothetical protein
LLKKLSNQAAGKGDQVSIIKKRLLKMKVFVNNWPGLLRHLSPVEKSNLFKQMIDGWFAINKPIMVSRWNDILIGFKEAREQSLESLRKNVPHANILKVLNLAKDEIRHSRMIAWLLDKEGSHMQGALFFEYFLNTLGLFEANYFYKEYQVERERPDRIDISVYSPGKFVIYIENKIDHPERDDQLDDEYLSLNKNSDDWSVPYDKRHLVFLTREGRDPVTLGKDSSDPYKKSINISYSDLVNAMRRAASSERCKSDYIKRLVMDYSFQIIHEIAESKTHNDMIIERGE